MTNVIRRFMVALCLVVQLLAYFAFLMISIPWLLAGGVEWIARGKSVLLDAGVRTFEGLLEPWYTE